MIARSGAAHRRAAPMVLFACRAQVLALAAGASLLLLAIPVPCLAGDPLATLHVTRSAGAGGCPDTAALDAEIARLVGRDAFAADPSEAPRVEVEVGFSHESSGYVATVTASDGRTRGVRRIVDGSPTCWALAQAVVASVAVMLDGLGTEAPPSSATPTPARDPAPEPPRPPPPDRLDPDDLPPRGAAAPVRYDKVTRWYGWQILVADVASFGTFVAVAPLRGTGADLLAGASLVSLVGDGAVIHGLHGRAGAAIGSASVRLALPLVGGMIAEAMAPPCTVKSGTGTLSEALGGALCPIAGAAYFAEGMLVGLVVASVVDVTALSWGHAREPRPASSAAISLEIAPVATMVEGPDGRRAPMLGLVGSF